MKKNWMQYFALMLLSIVIIASLTACGSGGGGGSDNTVSTNPVTNNPVTTDLCENDPNKTEPGICGCGVADTDSDSDGVADCIEPHFVAVGDNGTVISSIDGITWSSRGNGGTETLKDVAAGIWVAVGENSIMKGIVEKYDDVFTLTPATLTNAQSFSGIASDGAGNWAAAGTNNITGDAIIATSINVTFWTTQGTLAGGVLNDVAFGNGTGLAVGMDVNGDCIAWDSSGWAGIPAPTVVSTQCIFNAVAYNGNGDWVAVGQEYTNGKGYIAAWTGGNWSFAYTSGIAGLNGVASDGNGKFLAVGVDGNNDGIVADSTGAVKWTVTGASLNDIAYINGTWVAVGENGKVYYSVNGGDNWTAADSKTTEKLNGIASK